MEILLFLYFVLDFDMSKPEGMQWNPHTPLIESATTTFPALTQDDINDTGTLYQVELAVVQISGGNLIAICAIILWGSAIASAFVDNIPFAATMIPVIKSMSATMGIDLETLAWTLSMGTDIGGSATPIGASANVVGTSVAAKAGHPISWGVYCKKMVPATIIVLVISMVCIWGRYL